MRLICGAKPMSSMRSASSSTSTSRSSNTTFCRSRWSISRPGVATTTSTPARSFFSCGSSGTPPYTATTAIAGVLRVLPEALLHLHAQLARRREDERARAARAVDQPVDDRQRERGGLAGAGLREADEVAPAQRERDRVALDRRRSGVARVRDGREDALVEAEVLETDGLVGGVGGSVPARRAASTWSCVERKLSAEPTLSSTCTACCRLCATTVISLSTEDSVIALREERRHECQHLAWTLLVHRVPAADRRRRSRAARPPCAALPRTAAASRTSRSRVPRTTSGGDVGGASARSRCTIAATGGRVHVNSCSSRRIAARVAGELRRRPVLVDVVRRDQRRIAVDAAMRAVHDPARDESRQHRLDDRRARAPRERKEAHVAEARRVDQHEPADARDRSLAASSSAIVPPIDCATTCGRRSRAIAITSRTRRDQRGESVAPLVRACPRARVREGRARPRGIRPRRAARTTSRHMYIDAPQPCTSSTGGASAAARFREPHRHAVRERDVLARGRPARPRERSASIGSRPAARHALVLRRRQTISIGRPASRAMSPRRKVKSRPARLALERGLERIRRPRVRVRAPGGRPPSPCADARRLRGRDPRGTARTACTSSRCAAGIRAAPSAPASRARRRRRRRPRCGAAAGRRAPDAAPAARLARTSWTASWRGCGCVRCAYSASISR